MTARDDERAMAGLLRRGLGAGTNVPAGDCPRPDALAAYYDRSLDACEMVRCESHFSSCARCRAQLAALARTEPPPDGAARPARLWGWRWLVPTAVALTGLALWVALRPLHTSRQEKSKPLAQGVATPAPQNPAAETKQLAENAAPALPQGPQRAVPHAARAGSKTGEIAAGVPGRVRSHTGTPTGGAARGIIAARESSAPAVDRRVAGPPESKPQGRVENALVAAEEKIQAAPAPSSAAAPAAASSAPLAKESVGAAQRLPLSAAIGAEGGPNVTAHLQAFDSRSFTVIPTPDRSVLWQVGRAGLVGRSEDGGKTWLVERTNANADLLAGSAPSVRVCWIVGRAGTVLLTADGVRWRKVNSPADVDLVQIEARDARRATVIALDGRKFSTEDGGQSWHEKR